MKHVDITLATPALNLACDEALLDHCEDGFPHEILRFWQPTSPFVVLGYSQKAETEVNLDACRALNVPIFRRCSGGGAVVQASGCLNYALILKIQPENPLASITETNKFVMNQHKTALEKLLDAPISVSGFTDLAVGNLKFSGNSQRRKRNFLLFHGTFLLAFDISLAEKLLKLPSRQPPYRENRAHRDFLTNLDVEADRIKAALRKIWNANEELRELPRQKIESLAAEKYSRDEWNCKFF
jgi:lipoate-protein ligase A